MKTPFHLWIVGIVSLVWNAGGAVDYVMTQFRVEAYVSQLPPEALAYFDNVPIWFDAAWATGVWFSVLGSVLLLLRSRMAVMSYLLSLAGLIAASVHTYGIGGNPMMNDLPMTALLFSLAIPVLLVLQWLYARAMARRGVLR